MAAIELNSTSLISDANLNAYWRLESNADDTTANNNDGTSTDVTYSAANGMFNNGGGFDGDSSFISFTTTASLKPTGNFSIGAWFKSTSADFRPIFISYEELTDPSNGSGIRLGMSSGKIGVSVADTATHTTGIYTVDTVNDGNWHLAVGVYNGSNLIIYCDDRTPNSKSWTYNPAYGATSYQRIGCWKYNTGPESLFFSGSIDDVFLFSRALTAAEVSNIYSGSWGLGGSFSPSKMMRGIGS